MICFVFFLILKIKLNCQNFLPGDFIGQGSLIPVTEEERRGCWDTLPRQNLKQLFCLLTVLLGDIREPGHTRQ